MKYFKTQILPEEKIAQNFYILIKDERVEIKPEEIIYIQADVNYTNFLTSSKKFTTSFHLGFYAEVLANHQDFLRISKSHLLNIRFLKKVLWHKDTKTAELKNGMQLPISRRQAREIRGRLKDFLPVTY